MARVSFLLSLVLALTFNVLLVTADLQRAIAQNPVSSLARRHHSTKGNGGGSGGSGGGSGHSSGGSGHSHGSSGGGSGGGSAGDGTSGGDSGNDPLKGSGGTDKLGCSNIDPRWQMNVGSLKSCYKPGESVDFTWTLSVGNSGGAWPSSGLIFQLSWGAGENDYQVLFKNKEGTSAAKHCAGDLKATLPLDGIPSTAKTFEIVVGGFNGPTGAAPTFITTNKIPFGASCDS